MPVYCEWNVWLYILESDLPKLTIPSGVHNCILLGCNTLHYLGVPIYTFWVFQMYAAQKCWEYTCTFLKSVAYLTVHRKSVTCPSAQLEYACTAVHFWNSDASTFNDLILAVCADLSRKSNNQIYLICWCIRPFNSRFETPLRNLTNLQ